MTIDSKLQRRAASLLKNLDNLSGSIVALDVRTGGVLAIASYPSYNPNAFARGISPELYTAWMNSPFRPLFDRSIQGQYPPFDYKTYTSFGCFGEWAIELPQSKM